MTITKTHINWEGVAKELGVAGGNAANCRWRRFKKNQFGNNPRVEKGKVAKTRTTTNSPSKRGAKLENTVLVETPVRRLPARKNKGRTIKFETPSDGEEEEEEWQADDNKNDNDNGNDEEMNDDEDAAVGGDDEEEA